MFPSTWEGFGNPVIETVAARRPLAVGHYPVLDEIVAETGLELLAVDDPDAVAAALRAPDAAVLERNLARVRPGFDLREPPRPAAADLRGGRLATVVNGAPRPRSAPGPTPGRLRSVTERRARIARLVKIGQRVGYAFLLVAMITFVVGIATDFPPWTVDLTVASLVVAIVVLPVPIVLGYGVRAAEREERGGGRFH